MEPFDERNFSYDRI